MTDTDTAHAREVETCREARAAHPVTTLCLTPARARELALDAARAARDDICTTGGLGERTARALVAITAKALREREPQLHDPDKWRLDTGSEQLVLTQLLVDADRIAEADADLVIATDEMASLTDAYCEGEASWRDVDRAEAWHGTCRRKLDHHTRHMGEAALVLLVRLIDTGRAGPDLVPEQNGAAMSAA